jgi:EAL domain-containing protein (putative c-di-GMP-specific phosphodiesterase class I)
MKIVVEGVETKEILDFFVDLECDYIQGYYFSKPLPKDEFVEFIASSAY